MIGEGSAPTAETLPEAIAQHQLFVGQGLMAGAHIGAVPPFLLPGQIDVQ